MILKFLKDTEVLLCLLLFILIWGVSVGARRWVRVPEVTVDTHEGTWGKLTCEGFECLRLKHPLAPIEKLDVGRVYGVDRGEEFLILKPQSALRLRSNDGSEKVYRVVGTTVAQEGEKNFSLDPIVSDLGAESAEEPIDEFKDSNILFMGDMEIEVLSPLPGSVVLVQKLPHRFPLSLRARVNTGDELNLQRSKKWTLVRLQKENEDADPLLIKVKDLELKMLQKNRISEKWTMAELFEQIDLAQAGSYALLPSDRALKMDELRMKFEIRLAGKNLKKSLSEQLRLKKDKEGESNIFVE